MLTIAWLIMAAAAEASFRIPMRLQWPRDHWRGVSQLHAAEKYYRSLAEGQIPEAERGYRTFAETRPPATTDEMEWAAAHWMATAFIAEMAAAFGGISQLSAEDLGRALLGRVTNKGGGWSDLVRPEGSYHRPDEPPLKHPRLMRVISAIAGVYCGNYYCEDPDQFEEQILAAYTAAQATRAEKST